jgi:hypothetical protein
MPVESLTPRVQREVLEELADDDYRDAAGRAGALGNALSHTQAGRLLVATGERMHAELFGPDAACKPVGNPAEVLILEGDGARYRTIEADKTAAAPDATGDDELKRDERDKGWRENKIGIVVRARPGYTRADGTYQPPEEVLKTYVATVGTLEAFERDLQTEALRRGVQQALSVVGVSDNGHGLPAMWPRLAESLSVPFSRVTDFYHCAERLSACAKIVKGEGAVDKRERKRYFHRLRGLLWNGKTEKLIAALKADAATLAPRPERLSDLDGHPCAKTLWTNVFYFEKYADTMDYPSYRRKGWPMGSGAVESACGQFGERVKHNRMRWTRRAADALHVVKAAIYSQDGRWEKRWPPPIPILELPEGLAA